MVKKKNEDSRSLLEWMHDEHEQRKRDNPIVKTKYYVVEITPPKKYNYGDGHGGADWQWTSEKVVKVSPDFNDKVSAQVWLEKHEPDEGNKLKIASENLRKFTEHRWVSW